MNVWVDDVFTSPKRLAIPIMTHPGIEMIGKDVIDAVQNGDVHAQAIIALNNIYPADASTVIMDLTVEVEAFGAVIEFNKDEVPSVIGNLVSNKTEVDALKVPDLTVGRVSEYLKANEIVAKNITDKPVFGGAIGPFSLAGRLYDMTDIMIAIYIEPETVELLLQKSTQFIKSYIKAMKETGVSGVVIAEPAAGLLSNEDAMNYSSKYIKEIVDELQDDNFIIIMHNCGNTGHCTESMVSTGAKAMHFGNKIDILDALKQVPSNILVMGNLDPVEIFKQSTPEVVASATKDLLAKTATYRNFIISTGCDIPPAIPEENIAVFYKEVTAFI